jgi:hypothetical protein
MNHRHFRGALDRLDLSQVEAARLFGVTDRAVRRWAAAGNDHIPKAVAILLRLMLAGKVCLDEVRKTMG